MSDAPQHGGAQHPEELPENKSDPSGDADREQFDVFEPSHATAVHPDQEKDPEFWGRTPVEAEEPSGDDASAEEQSDGEQSGERKPYLEEAMPDDPAHAGDEGPDLHPPQHNDSDTVV